jgi:crossover junction endodeoxyribonuclease RusA
MTGPGVSGPLVITVMGKPAPQGSKRHVGGGRMIEQSQRTAPWREAVRNTAAWVLEVDADWRTRHGHPPRQRPEGPVKVEVDFCFDPPKSAPKRRRSWPITRSSGDVDKLLRACLDALTEAGVLRDDSQVTEVTGRKIHTDDPRAPVTAPGAVIRVWPITPEEV